MISPRAAPTTPAAGMRNGEEQRRANACRKGAPHRQRLSHRSATRRNTSPRRPPESTASAAAKRQTEATYGRPMQARSAPRENNSRPAAASKDTRAGAAARSRRRSKSGTSAASAQDAFALPVAYARHAHPAYQAHPAPPQLPHRRLPVHIHPQRLAQSRQRRGTVPVNGSALRNYFGLKFRSIRIMRA